jgi:PAS domain S-box-containing protein
VLELNAIFENATVGILFTHNRKLMQANRLCAEIFGYALDEFLGQPALILYENPEAYSALGRVAGPVLSRGESFKTETQLKRSDGSLVWCRVSAKAIDPDYPSDGTLWFIEDITGDRSMLEALAHSTSELSAIFDSASLGIAVVRKGVFARCNQRLEEMLRPARRVAEGPVDKAIVQQRRRVPARRRADQRRVLGRRPASARTDIPACRRHGGVASDQRQSPRRRLIHRPGRSGWSRTSRPRMKPRSARGRPSTSSR